MTANETFRVWVGLRRVRVPELQWTALSAAAPGLAGDSPVPRTESL